MIQADSTLEEVAFHVCSALEDAGITAVLTGGSAATVHSQGGYSSLDLDFVMTRLRGAEGAGEAALQRLGYRRDGGQFAHEACPLALDFLRGPLAVGAEVLTVWETRQRRGLTLHLLRAADSIKDRLAAFLHWGDVRGLDQAAAVWRRTIQDVDLEELRAWVAAEGGTERWSLILARLA
ncbi:MAG: hypothetical protein H8E31_07125 [Planctomycetes bacterium]|nr:hypothetical protein [Planctomycetota bacterium]